MTFLEALLEEAGLRPRLERAAVWMAFRRAHSVEALGSDARQRLAERLRVLAEEGCIVLPAERGAGWDRTARPALPEWLRFPRPEAPPIELDPLRVPWAPELAFVVTLARVEYAGELLAMQRFFADGGRHRPVIPMRERSVQLFGDEKRLERLVRTPLFEDGRLTLATLRCFAMAPPLVFVRGPPGTAGSPALVVENHHPWWSFCRWNERIGQYSGVVYGAGGGFGRDAVAFLAERCREWQAPWAAYVGDLDADGLNIPRRAATQFAPTHQLQLVPETRWYAAMLDRAGDVPLPVAGPIEAEEGIAWLPAELRERVRGHFRAGRRIPQELVGTEELTGEGRLQGLLV